MLGWMGNSGLRRARAVATAFLAIATAGPMLLGPHGAQAANDVVHINSAKNASIRLAKGKPKTDVPFYEIVIGDPRSPTSIR
jgi:pilus assembly protein CpaC